MITFLPYAEYERSAAVLDRQRLGKQRIEVLALLKASADSTHRLAPHPACRMWSKRRCALAVYGLSICDEWINRGYLDTTRPEILRFINVEITPSYSWLRERDMLPWWDGLAKLHDSHRSNLLRKDKSWYGHFGWEIPNDLPYYWPVRLFD